jgi:arsenate reductase
MVKAMPELTVYERSSCSKCRNLAMLLQERGVDFDAIEFHVTGLEAAELRDLVRKLGVPARDLLREDHEVDDEEAIALMVRRPELLQRPIVVRGDRAVVARPAELVLELLD